MKILVTGDILRPNNQMESLITIQTKWFLNLFKPIFDETTKEKIELVLWEGNGFDANEFYRLNNSRFDCVEDWAKLYNANYIKKEANDYLCSFFRDSFIIGYEMSNLMMNCFNKNNIPYINATLHPARFLDDVFFMFCTNVQDIFNILETYSISNKKILDSVKKCKMIIRKKPKLKILENSALIIGQTNVDASVCSQETNKLLSLYDYENELKEIVNKFNKVYFKPHPYAWEKDKLKTYMDKLGIESLNENVYYCLGQDNLDSVYAISSSAVYEANLFNKEGRYFYKSAFDIYDLNNKEYNHLKYVGIYNDYFSTDFWRNILNKYCKALDNNFSFKPVENRIRKSLNMYWGYDIFME